MNRQRCQGCRAELVSLRRGEWTVKSKILVLEDDGTVTAKCYRCGEPTQVHTLSWEDPSPESDDQGAIRGVKLRAGVRRRLDSSGES